jgi:ferredoxin
MADATQKHSANAAGSWYVDTNCIGCELCVQTAPDNFKMDDDSQAFVSAQPADDAQLSACRESLEGCPVEAIGDDG